MGARLARWRDLLLRMGGRGLYPEELAFLLTLPGRGLVLSPGKLADRLRLGESDRVLELGPGPGYFSAEVARRLPRGRLELFDIQRGMLAKARRRLRRAGCGNADFAQGDARALPYRDGCFDAAFLVAVLGEVPDPEAALAALHRCLRPGGLLSVTEQPGDPDFTPFAELRALAAAAGFDFEERLGAGRNYTASFRRKEADWSRPTGER